MSQDFDAPLEQPKKSNTGLIVGIIVAVALICLCCCIIVFVTPVILGPSIDNVFSNIIEGLEAVP